MVTNAEYLEFIKDGGYETPEVWLSEGWVAVETNNWKAPLYWQQSSDEWMQFTLGGLRKVEPDEPLTHVSYFETPPSKDTQTISSGLWELRPLFCLLIYAGFSGFSDNTCLISVTINS